MKKKKLGLFSRFVEWLLKKDEPIHAPFTFVNRDGSVKRIVDRHQHVMAKAKEVFSKKKVGKAPRKETR